MTPKNLLILMSDEHNPKIMGCAGHDLIATANLNALIRSDIPKRKGGDKMAKLSGPGESPYTVYDREIASRAQIWLHEAAARKHDKPWVLFVSFVAPHFPLTAPAEWYYRYIARDLPW